jgi:putative glutamine amidotransferase
LGVNSSTTPLGTRPLVGVSAEIDTIERYWGTSPHQLVTASYVDAVRRAGGLAAILPTGTAAEAEAIIQRIDALVITGGSDLDPTTYGQARIDAGTGGAISSERDEFDLTLARLALAAGIPTLCICRGLQVLNVALGGTLVQHLEHHPLTPFPHAPADRYDTQPLVVDANSRFARLFPDINHANSFHHQAVDQPGTGVRIAATAADGVVEVIEVDGAAHVIAVQWHPEELPHLPEHQALFTWLIEAARARRSASV